MLKNTVLGFGQQAVNVERVLGSNKELEVRFSDDFPSLPNHILHNQEILPKREFSTKKQFMLCSNQK